MSNLTDLREFVEQHPGYMRCDMRFMVNEDEKRITHTNMWLVGRSVPILGFMDPLPLVVLLPLFAASIDPESDCTDYLARLDGAFGVCSTCLLSCVDDLAKVPGIAHDGANQLQFTSESSSADTERATAARKAAEEVEEDRGRTLFELLFKWRHKLLAEWQSSDTSRHVIFNSKNASAITDALLGRNKEESP